MPLGGVTVVVTVVVTAVVTAVVTVAVTVVVTVVVPVVVPAVVAAACCFVVQRKVHVTPRYCEESHGGVLNWA